MKVRTHFNIVRLSLKNSTNTSFRGKLYQKMYCIGAMLPDFSIMQFRYRHFYGSSREYVYEKIKKLKEKKDLNAIDILTIGCIVHYLSDYSCYPHRNESIGNAKYHILYERKLNI
jgi:hypothetical protein